MRKAQLSGHGSHIWRKRLVALCRRRRPIRSTKFGPTSPPTPPVLFGGGDAATKPLECQHPNR